jgi:hypothetical protein
VSALVGIKVVNERLLDAYGYAASGVGDAPARSPSLAAESRHADALRNSPSGLLSWLMFPDADHLPSCFRKIDVISAVALDVALQLSPPELGVPGGQRPVVRTAMPEAAVDEDSDPQAGEDDVGADAGSRNAMVDPVAETPTVERATQSELGPRVSAAVGAHRR